ncbi:plasmid SOS inhibition protein A [Photorhabdus luminescens]|uniref:plasmid SOS inhibition protein A n=1 Tax=Photorhabdus luminescens TaxID=29488 RepID=UPI00223F1EA6|nr:plasmid SOS inhibition protein A [Photorhabdus luminescens]MCW7764553.1 plasmid SOS inhibition protein A [Photorhabdus luminescens subsp. venezuelensis]
MDGTGEGIMIPNHLSLVPVNPFQYAAMQAIITVEDKRVCGKKQERHPYVRAFFRHFCGSKGGISSADLCRAVFNYSPRDRDGALKKQYIEALDRLIESRGEVCSFPLSGSTVGDYFPEVKYRQSERQNRQWDIRFLRHNKVKEKERQQKRRRYQKKVGRAEIELAFTTPSELLAWYKRQERQGIYDDDLIGMVQAWSQRFTNLRSEVFYAGYPLWSIMDNMRGELAGRSVIEQWLDALMLAVSDHSG